MPDLGVIWPFVVAGIGLALLAAGWLLLEFDRERLAQIYLKVGGGMSLTAAVAIAAYGWKTTWVLCAMSLAGFVLMALWPVMWKLEKDNPRLKSKFAPLFVLSMIFGGPVYVGLVALVVFGIPILLSKWLGFWGCVLAVVIIVGAFWLYSALFEKNNRSRDTASDIGEGKLKKCSTCGKLKPIEAFKDPKLKSGIGRKCLACKLAD